MKPLIGITAELDDEKETKLHKQNHNRVIESGGIPFILPNTEEKSVIKEYVNRIDGLLLTGGDDISPLLYDEAPDKSLGKVSPGRDAFEMILVQEALRQEIPILGLCRGAQIVNTASGGSLYQDVEKQLGDEVIQHSQEAPREYLAHTVTVQKDSLLFKITNSEELKVNTYHHQAVKTPGRYLMATSHASDGVIESIESTKHDFVIGVQWHPEYLYDEASTHLFKSFIKACTQNNN